MRVDYAAQTLSQRVATGIWTAAKLDIYCRILWIIQFFDWYFNSQGPNDNEYNAGLCREGESMKFWLEAKGKLNSIRYLGDGYRNTLSCLICWRNNVVHLILLYSNLEFNIIHADGGNRDIPSALEFLAECKMVAMDSLFW